MLLQTHGDHLCGASPEDVVDNHLREDFLKSLPQTSESLKTRSEIAWAVSIIV